MIWPFQKKQIDILEEDESEFIIVISTSNFDKMIEFFTALEIEVRDTKMNQLCPLFNNERGVTLWVGDKLIANIEENTALQSSAYFNLFLVNIKYTQGKLKSISNKLNQKDVSASVYGGFIYTFISPDGGKVAILTD